MSLGGKLLFLLWAVPVADFQEQFVISQFESFSEAVHSSVDHVGLVSDALAKELRLVLKRGVVDQMLDSEMMGSLDLII